MKKATLLATLSVFLLLGAGCQLQQIEEQVTSLPPAAEELQTQTVPESEKQEKSETTITQEPTQIGTTLYRGSWFDVEYPQDFVAKPANPTTVYNGQTYVQTDEAYFTSPDGTVEFFVYSPLWSGNPETYLKILPTEEIVSEKTETGEALPFQLKDSKRIIRWVTVKAKDASYCRSFVSIREQVSDEGHSEVHHVFGIKYKDSESYEKYREAYIAFKESLKQYSD